MFFYKQGNFIRERKYNMTANFRGNVSYVYDKDTQRSLLRVRLRNGRTQDVQYSKDRNRKKLEDFGEVRQDRNGAYYRSLSPRELNELQNRYARQGGMTEIPMVRLEGKELAKYRALKQFETAKQQHERMNSGNHVTATVDLKTTGVKDDKTADAPVKTSKAPAVKEEENSQKTEAKTDVSQTQDQYPKKLGNGFMEVAPGKVELDYDDPEVKKDIEELEKNPIVAPFPKDIKVPEESEENNLGSYLYEKAQPLLDKAIDKSSQLVKDFEAKLENFKKQSQVTPEEGKEIAGEVVNEAEEGLKAAAAEAKTVEEEATVATPTVDKQGPTYLERVHARAQQEAERIAQQILPNVGNEKINDLTKEYRHKTIESAETTVKELFSNMKITQSGFTLTSKDGTPNSILVDNSFQEKAQKCIDKLANYYKRVPYDEAKIQGILVGIATGNIPIDVVNNASLDSGNVRLLSGKFYNNRSKNKVENPLTQEQRMYLLKAADKKLKVTQSLSYNRWMMDAQDTHKQQRIVATLDALFDPTKTE